MAKVIESLASASVAAKVPTAVCSSATLNEVVVITGASLALTTVTDTVSTSVNEPPSVAVI